VGGPATWPAHLPLSPGATANWRAAESPTRSWFSQYPSGREFQNGSSAALALEAGNSIAVRQAAASAVTPRIHYTCCRFLRGLSGL